MKAVLLFFVVLNVLGAVTNLAVGPLALSQGDTFGMVNILVGLFNVFVAGTCYKTAQYA